MRHVTWLRGHLPQILESCSLVSSQHSRSEPAPNDCPTDCSTCIYVHLYPTATASRRYLLLPWWLYRYTIYGGVLVEIIHIYIYIYIYMFVGKTTPKGFGPSRAEPNGFLVHHLSHPVTVSLQTCNSKPEYIIMQTIQWTTCINYYSMAITDYHHQLKPNNGRRQAYRFCQRPACSDSRLWYWRSEGVKGEDWREATEARAEKGGGKEG